MLQLNGLSLSFGGQDILDDVGFNIHNGERIGLVGRNGSGKTTLFKIITGEIKPDMGIVSLPKNYSIGYLKQHLSFTEMTVLQEACLGLKPEEEDQIWKAEKILLGLGFSEDEFYMSPEAFSGGFQVRLNLAKVLLGEPHLLLLDEPTNYLDIISIRWLTTFLKRWPNELMIITHDRDFMNSITTHTMAIHRKIIKKMEGNTAKLYEQIALEEEIYELTRQKEQKKRDETMEFINRFRAQAARASLVQSRVKSLERMGVKKEMGKIMELGFRFNALDFQAQTIMRTDRISFGYSAEKTLIKNFSIDIGCKDRIGVIGKNGKGKTTLLRLLASELIPSSGEITRHPSYQQGYFGQTNIERLNPNNTIEKELGDVRSDVSYGEVRGTCGAMMFTGDLALKKISVLSGGEKSRVSLGKILLTPTNILLLDEPTNHLDIESCDSMIAALDDFPNAVIIVTHSEMFLHHLANRLIVFTEEGVSVFEGTYQDFLDKVGWEDDAKKPKKEKKSEPKSGDSSSKENKKIRKDLLQKITTVETNIDNEEAAFKAINQKMTDSFGKLTSSEIKNFQIKSHEHQMIIDAGYKELERLIEELDKLDKG